MVRSNPKLTSGTRFEDRYDVLSELGSGGFGAVYKARQLTTGQTVALKIIRLPEHDSAATSDKRNARFLRETQLCAQLHHPNIVQLIDAGQTREGLLYTVFSFAPGETLAELLAREGPLDFREARHLMSQVLDALACAHAQGVIHRDLKPRNIMVIPTGARRNAVVLDFGISGILRETQNQGFARLTVTGEALGTLGYAAPEQLRGLEPTPGADLFSWGLVFLECLTGRPVYSGNSAAELFHAQLGPEPIPIPSVIDAHPLGELLRSVMNKDVNARRLNARELLAAVEACEPRGLSREALRGHGFSANTMGAPREQVGTGDSTETSELSQLAQEGERRQLTAVCCQLKVLPAGPRALDAEELNDLFQLLPETCANIGRRYRGLVAATLGDQVLLYFGYPRAEEDDARRAARAALDIATALQAEGDRLAAQGVRLEGRLGIHTGFVVTRSSRVIAHASLSVGTTPQMAMEAAALAPPGGVLVTSGSQRLLRSAFEFGEVEPAPGSRAPVELFQLQRERDTRSSPSLPEERMTPFVGREQEVGLLLGLWRQARTGSGQCSLLTGEPGIGKSRLARELREQLASESHAFLEGRCTPDTRNNAFYPVLELLRRTLELDQESSPRGQVTRLEAQLVGLGFTPAEAMPLLLPLFSLPLEAPYAPLALSPQRQKELTLNALLSLLFAMAEKQPLLLLLEDLHWADPATLELVTQLVQEVPTVAMCLLLTARPEFSPPFPIIGMLQLHLGRLERPQIMAMAKELVGGRSLPSVVMEQVVNRTDGVPLFVEELTWMMLESGVLVEREDRYELARPLSLVETPSTLRDLLTARLDRLGRAKDTAQTAAALGREFSLEVLSSVSTLGAPGVQEDLDKLLKAGLVFRKRRLKDAGYVFKHALIRDAAYESLSKETRKKVHARIAEQLEERFPEILETRPDVLAHHHAAAEQKQQAIGYARQAAMNALQRSALAQAIAHCQEAIGWLNVIEDPSERAGTELSLIGILSPALMSSEGYASPSVGKVLNRARGLCESLGLPAQLFPVLWGLGAYYAVRADHRNATDVGKTTLEIAERQADPALLVPAHLLNGGTHLWKGNFSDAHAHFTEALRHHDPEKHAGLADLYSYEPGIALRSYQALNQWFLGHSDQALASARDAAARSTSLNHFHTSIHTLVRSAQLHLLRREGAVALEQSERIIALSEEKGLSLWQAQGTILRGWALIEIGRVEQGIVALRTGLAGWVGTGAEVHRSWYLTVLADGYRRSGNAEEGLAATSEALEHCERSGDCIYLAESHRLKGKLLLLTDARPGRDEEAEEQLKRALDIARTQKAKALELRAAMSIARLWKQRGEATRARRLLEELHGSFSEGLDTRDLMDAEALLREL